MLVVEICTDSIAGVRAAMDAGAQRIELCAALMEGGITPSIGLVRRAIATANGALKIHVIIRPRGGDFLYDDDERQAMADDIDAVAAAGADGIVVGLLSEDGAIDEPSMAALITRARPLSVTCHRAFDVTKDPMASLEALIRLGVDRLLTSGQEPTVLGGAPLIRRLIGAAAGRIVVMPGGDITVRNAARILAETGASELHFAAFEMQSSGMTWRREGIPMGGALRPPEFDRPVTTARAIGAILSSLG